MRSCAFGAQTGAFMNGKSRCSPPSLPGEGHRAVSQKIECGINASLVGEFIDENFPFAELLLLRHARTLRRGRHQLHRIDADFHLDQLLIAGCGTAFYGDLPVWAAGMGMCGEAV
jgi:hypothetical protein